MHSKGIAIHIGVECKYILLFLVRPNVVEHGAFEYELKALSYIVGCGYSDLSVCIDSDWILEMAKPKRKHGTTDN